MKKEELTSDIIEDAQIKLSRAHDGKARLDDLTKDTEQSIPRIEKEITEHQTKLGSILAQSLMTESSNLKQEFSKKADKLREQIVTLKARLDEQPLIIEALKSQHPVFNRQINESLPILKEFERYKIIRNNMPLKISHGMITFRDEIDLANLSKKLGLESDCSTILKKDIKTILG